MVTYGKKIRFTGGSMGKFWYHNAIYIYICILPLVCTMQDSSYKE